MILRLLALVLSFSAHAAISPEIGNPIYVLEKSKNHQDTPEIEIWEIRTADQNRTFFSGSRLIFKHKGINVTAFGFDHVTITPEEITPGLLYLRDARGKVYKIELELEDHEGRGKMTAVAQAPEGVFEAPRNEIDLASETWRLERDAKGTPVSLSRLEKASNMRQSKKLSEIFQSQKDEAGGQEFQFLGSGEGVVYARAGNHYLAFSPTQDGKDLSIRELASRFFGHGLRTYGVNYTAFSEVLVVQPPNADRTGFKRGDMNVRDLMTAEEFPEPEPMPAGESIMHTECNNLLGRLTPEARKNYELMKRSPKEFQKKLLMNDDEFKKSVKEVKKEMEIDLGNNKYPIILKKNI